MNGVRLNREWFDYSEGSRETKVNFVLDRLLALTNKNSITSIIIPNFLQRVFPRDSTHAVTVKWTQESKKLAGVLSQYPHLTHLDLSRNKLEWVQLLQIVTQRTPVQWRCTALTHLDLHSCDILDHGGLDYVARVLEQWQCEKLTYLNLAHNCSYNIFQNWAPILEPLTELRHLNLNTNFMKERSSTVAHGLRRCTTLTHLEMHDNHIGAKGMEILAPVLQGCPELTHLMLGNNQIGNAGADHLAGVFSTCTKLVHVHLGGGNGIYITALCALSVLAHLDVEFTQMEDGGAENLAEYLPQYTALTNLSIAGNAITEVGTRNLLPALSQCTKLVGLDMRSNWIRTAAEDLVNTCLQLATDKTKFELNINACDVPFEMIEEIHQRRRDTTLDLKCM